VPRGEDRAGRPGHHLSSTAIIGAGHHAGFAHPAAPRIFAGDAQPAEHGRRQQRGGMVTAFWGRRFYRWRLEAMGATSTPPAGPKPVGRWPQGADAQPQPSVLAGCPPNEASPQPDASVVEPIVWLPLIAKRQRPSLPRTARSS